jgi:hypothetical protein
VSFARALVVLALCGCGATSTPARCDDCREWQLLHDAVDGTPASFGALAQFYEQLGAWDEYSAVRTRMLAFVPPGKIPIPGGPFPRIGVPRDGAPPRTVLSRWLNRRDVPELYAETQFAQDALVAQLGEQPASPATTARIADVLCTELRFRDAATLYERALIDLRGDTAATTRAHLDDVRRILRGD